MMIIYSIVILFVIKKIFLLNNNNFATKFVVAGLIEKALNNHLGRPLKVQETDDTSSSPLTGGHFDTWIVLSR
jgi:hypothetical protein